MGKRAKTNKTNKKSKDDKSNVHKRKRETFMRKFQEAVESYNDTYNCDFDFTPPTRSNVPESSRRDSFTESETNSRHEDFVYNNSVKCYRCEHFSEALPNLPQPFCKRVPVVIGQCKVRVSFIDALNMLKFTTTHVSQIPIDKLRQIYSKQWSIYDKCNYSEKRRTENVKQSFEAQRQSIKASPVTEDLSIHKETAIKNPSTSYRQNLSDASDASGDALPQAIYELHSNSEDSQDENLASIRSISPIEPLTQERCTGWHKVRGMRNKASSPTSDIIPATDSEAESFCLSLSFESPSDVFDMFDDKPEHQNERLEDTFFCRERYADDQEECKSDISVYTISSIESFTNFPITPTSSCHNLIDLPFDSSPDINNLLTQISQMTIFRTHDVTHEKQKNANNSPEADQMKLSFSNDDVKFQIDDDDIVDMQVENGTENIEHDNACSTSHIVTFKCDSVLNDDNQYTSSGSNTEHRYELRNRNKRKTCTLMDCANVVEEVISSPSAMGSRYSSSISNKRSPLKRYKSTERAKTPSKKKEGSKAEIVSANWLNFTLDSQNLEEIMFESLKVILSILCDERMAEEYATHGWWKDTLEEEAVNAVSTLSDILKMEKKPNICSKEIVTAINKTLNEMTRCVRPNKMSVWAYRVRIILELCNSLSICVAVIDHLIAKLEPLRSTLRSTSETMTSQRTDQLIFSITINQVHFIFYALGIALRKYRTVVSSSREAAEDAMPIPHVADLWKTRYIDEELEDAGLNVDAAEKQWINALKNFENFVLFDKKSDLLVYILLST